MVDGALTLVVEPGLERLVRAWLPRVAMPGEVVHDAPARILVRSGAPPFRATGPGSPCIDVLGLFGWLRGGDEVVLATGDRLLHATVDLASRLAVISVPPGPSGPATERYVFRALTVATALLLGRQGRILLHAAGFMAPDGRGWLLVGPSHSGKSSTCATLIRSGWEYLADDQVVVGTVGRRLQVEGWPRTFHLDDGFHEAASVGQRSPVDPSGLGPGGWRRTAPLAGLLLPRIEGPAPTELRAATPADALAALIRESPWLLADDTAAPDLLALLTRMAHLPRFDLRLGSDVYGDPARLVAALEPALRPPGPPGPPASSLRPAATPCYPALSSPPSARPLPQHRSSKNETDGTP